jgi:hypothetical protein
MIKIEKTSVVGWEDAIRGLRNPKDSWDKSDSHYALSGSKYMPETGFAIGPNDHKLMMALAKGGPVHAKYRRYIDVYVDITAPLYWWKEFDTYRTVVGPNPYDIEMNSCSTMHRITAKEFTVDNFSHEHLIVPEPEKVVDEDLTAIDVDGNTCYYSPIGMLKMVVKTLNRYRELYLATEDPELKKLYWWQLIQLLPSSYNQKRTLKLNYETLAAMYEWRHNHKQDEWRDLCQWIENLPYSEIITVKRELGYEEVLRWIKKNNGGLTSDQIRAIDLAIAENWGHIKGD